MILEGNPTTTFISNLNILKEYLLGFEIWFPFLSLFDLLRDPKKIFFSVSVSAQLLSGSPALRQ